MFVEFIDNGLQALLELTTIFGAGDHGSHIQNDHAFVEQQSCHLALNDAQCQALDNSALTHAGQADEDGIVLLATTEDLRHALNLAFAPHDGIQHTLLGSLRQVCAEGV